MPRKIEWIHRLPEIVSLLKPLETELLDRSAMEVLFRVSSRQATRIMRKLGAQSFGGALLLERTKLLAQVEQLQGSPTVVFEQRRHARLAEQLREAQRTARSRQIEIPVISQEVWKIDALPAGVRLGPGELTVCFASPVELLERLMLLANSIAEDWAAFEGQARSTAQKGL